MIMTFRGLFGDIDNPLGGGGGACIATEKTKFCETRMTFPMFLGLKEPFHSENI